MKSGWVTLICMIAVAILLVYFPISAKGSQDYKTALTVSVVVGTFYLPLAGFVAYIFWQKRKFTGF